MQEQTHRKPGPPMRNIDEDAMEVWDKENLDKLSVHSKSVDRDRTPAVEDAQTVGTKRNSPLK